MALKNGQVEGTGTNVHDGRSSIGRAKQGRAKTGFMGDRGLL